ncbi:small multidrug resistance protein [Gloeocapsopsis sp. AAB1 = 1H9]|uniref:Small multidrug resistance protein n=2 Tax=Gloeocapsopsis TaxID=693222 RepID=A0A6N8FRZ8_9CHRO|nr:small multidrug resistance protein [Gloeocapsopsis dulcis AAB1 = 1H9]
MQYSWLLVFVAAIANATGTVFLKKSRLAAADAGFVNALISPWFLSALLIYTIGLLLFTQALGQLPVSASQPVMAGVSFVSAALLASVIFGEQLSFNHLVAISLIVAGIAVMTRS